MRTKRRTTIPLALLAWLSASVATAQTTFVAGPVERLSSDFAQVTVLGQTYVLDAETVFAANGRRISSFSGMRALQAGVLVAIESGPQPQSRRAGLVAVTTAQYVAGATPLFVGGTVDQVIPEYGTLKIGGLLVDVSATPPDVLAAIDVGSFVEVSGTQPSPQGVLLGKDIVISATPSLQSISGTGRAISTQSISGTGRSSALQSISGTGSSVSAQSISGTGSSVSAQSISGTGSGVSVQSISGTGKSVSSQSISGTGSSVSAQSISGTGSGVSAQSISGTGKSVSTQSISGTGSSVSAQSISGTGSGVSTQSISGTGSSTSLQSISGTGSAAL